MLEIDFGGLQVQVQRFSGQNDPHVPCLLVGKRPGFARDAGRNVFSSEIGQIEAAIGVERHFKAIRVSKEDDPVGFDPCLIEVDGGIDLNTLPAVVRAGAEILVAGSAIFHSSDPGQKVREMLEMAAPLSYHSNFV